MSDLLVRPATLADTDAVLALVNEVDAVDTGTSDYSRAELVDDLTRPRLDLARDSWLALRSDVLVAYAIVWDEYATGRIDVEHYVRPGHVADGLVLIDRLLARAVEVAAANGAAEAVVQLTLTPRSVLALGPLTARGWQPVRRWNVLTCPVSVGPALTPPPGISLRAAVEPADHHAAYQLIQVSFAEHYNHLPESYEQWCVRIGNDVDWSLAWLASRETAGGRVDVGVAVCRDRVSMGWIGDVGVLPEARGNGVAGFLLRTAFGEFARRGRHTVGLGVDTHNATGALRLYEHLGMRVAYATDTWEIRLPTGA